MLPGGGRFLERMDFSWEDMDRGKRILDKRNSVNWSTEGKKFQHVKGIASLTENSFMTLGDITFYYLDLKFFKFSLVQFSSAAQLCPTLCDPMNRSTPGFPVHHQLPEFTQTHVHWVGDAIQPSHPLSSPSPPAFNLSQHQGLFKWVSSSHEVAKALEFQLQHQSFQWTLRTDLL